MDWRQEEENMKGTILSFCFYTLMIDLPIKEQHPLSLSKDQQVIQVFFISILLLFHVFLTTNMLSRREVSPPINLFKNLQFGIRLIFVVSWGHGIEKLYIPRLYLSRPSLKFWIYFLQGTLMSLSILSLSS